MDKPVIQSELPRSVVLVTSAVPYPTGWPVETKALLIYTIESHLTFTHTVLRIVDAEDHGFISERIICPEHSLPFLDIVKQQLTADEPQILSGTALMTMDKQHLVLLAGDFAWCRSDGESWTFSLQQNVYISKDQTPQAQQLALFFNAGRRYIASLQ